MQNKHFKNHMICGNDIIIVKSMYYLSDRLELLIEHGQFIFNIIVI